MGFSDSGLTDEQGVVLAPSAEDLEGAGDLVLAADEGVDAAVTHQLVEIGGVKLQGVLFGFRLGFRCRRLAGLGGRLRAGFRLLVGSVMVAVGDGRLDVQAADVLTFEEMDRVGLLFAEHRHQHIGSGNHVAA